MWYYARFGVGLLGGWWVLCFRRVLFCFGCLACCDCCLLVSLVLNSRSEFVISVCVMAN